MIIVLFIVFFFLILRFVVTLFNFISNPKLHKVARQHHELVSVLIPARNEESNILTLLQSIETQDYQDYEVIVLDDDSSDQTYAICEAFMAGRSRFQVIKGEPLKDDWLGKNYACYQLARQARGRYFLFLDADEKVYKGLLNSAVHRMQVQRLALLSLFTNQVMRTIGERMVVPLMHYVLLNLLPVRLIYIAKNYAVAAASGQFMLFDATIYRQQQWHQQSRNRVVEDVEIMKLVKAEGYSGEGLLANGLIACRMYTGYRDAINGFSKNFLAAFNYSIPGFIFYMLLLIGGPLLVFATLNVPLIVMMCGLIILTRIMISLSSGQNAWYNVVLHPLQMLSLAVIGYYAIQNHFTRNTMWKGRRV
ncbi:glycosyltransferase [Mucilaginibacter robiniae]|uniref:Glycosyltransferase n=1 Tax=Mucilaginibacter robiniae TaxID=2728022 RepID=A0A7L5E467_9SPHI|nr:glycosyltransferase [Mucilaginibacter robiniae]QJD97079.1 glycosyltransferase [Mucilaginibacter robiniae]